MSNSRLEAKDQSLDEQIASAAAGATVGAVVGISALVYFQEALGESIISNVDMDNYAYYRNGGLANAYILAGLAFTVGGAALGALSGYLVANNRNSLFSQVSQDQIETPEPEFNVTYFVTNDETEELLEQTEDAFDDIQGADNIFDGVEPSPVALRCRS